MAEKDFFPKVFLSFHNDDLLAAGLYF